MQTDDTLGRYRLDRCIGRGGMAEVWKATAEGPVGFSKTVAIKRIHPHLIDATGAFEAFASEARLAARLHHPNVVQVFDFDFARMPNGQPGGFIAMEFVDGVNLSRLLRMVKSEGQALPADVVAYIGAQAAAGLAYAHSETSEDGRPLRIVHRDVSPQNVLMSRGGEVKIADFGIAKFADAASKTDPGVVKGKISYMSPEQIHRLDVDGRADIFALGLVIYEMLAGERLFQGNSLADVAKRVSTFEGLSTPERMRVPLRFQDVIRRCLAVHPDERYQSAKDIEVELSQILGGRAPHARDALAALVAECAGGPTSRPAESSEEDEDLPPTRVTGPSLAAVSGPVSEPFADAGPDLNPPLDAPPPPAPAWLWLVVAGACIAVLGGLGFALVQATPNLRADVAGNRFSRGFLQTTVPPAPKSTSPEPSTSPTPHVSAQPTSRPTAAPGGRPHASATPARTRDDPVPVDIKVIDELGRQVAPLNIQFCGHHVYTRNGSYYERVVIESRYFDSGCDVRVFSGSDLLATRKVLPRTDGPIELDIRVVVNRPTPRPKPVADARVRISSRPDGATVKIDGKVVGETGSVLVVAIPGGEHQITFQRGSQFVQRTFSIRSGQEREVECDLRRKRIRVD